MKKILIFLTICILCFTSYLIGYNTTTSTTNLSLIKILSGDETLDWFDNMNDNLDLIDAIFDDVTLTEFGYLDGVTSAIQTQFGLRYLKTEMDSFSELQAIISDKTLVNEEDVFTIDANWVNTANPWADDEVSDTLTSSSCTGLAATATALATGRNIGGVSFDGTAAITPIYLIFDHALGSDEDYVGITDTVTVGYTTAIGDLMYFDFTATEWLEAQADAFATTPAMRIALEVKSDGQECLALVRGYIRDDDAFDFGAARIFLNDDTAGLCDDTAPAESGDQIQVVGIGVSADILYFCPSKDVGEI